VRGIDFLHDAVYGLYADDLVLSGVAHVIATGETAEFGLSVLEPYRRQGCGTALLERASTWARNHGVKILYTHCLTENAVMMHMAGKLRMRIVIDSGEADAYLSLSPGTVATATEEMMEDGVAMFDHALKTYAAVTQRLWRMPTI
jgi:GNAT superfamily N-acetyltransferase